ncbi:MAG: tyrosine-type recombinase/integrase [Gloeocapsa sp. UFS-A4-WI-NPMV-4B04]|jgi:integrase/recombinase XerD|nr:tyrosine-type recombinase/integrase [Gloeocapsa sp. UFS-A4-WI-NPMV-4B04]
MSSRSIPDIQIVPVRVQPTVASAGATDRATSGPRSTVEDLRSLRVEEFLMARSLAAKTKKAYEQDLQRFLDWTNTSWIEVTPRQVAQFKEYLMRSDPKSGKRVLKDATVYRTLGTLKNLYGWMFRSRYVNHDPTTEVDKPKLKEPTAQNLTDEALMSIYQAVINSSLPERNAALISVLLHGLRASEAAALNLEDYDGQRLVIRVAKADSKGAVPLTSKGKSDLDVYLKWRQLKGDILLHPSTPLFVSHSRRNQGERLSYDGIRKVVELIEKQTGIDLHAHQFRHTFATNLVLKGMNPYHVMTLTRHKSVQSFRRYTKAADQAAAEAAFYEING